MVADSSLDSESSSKLFSIRLCYREFIKHGSTKSRSKSGVILLLTLVTTLVAYVHADEKSVSWRWTWETIGGSFRRVAIRETDP